MKGILFCLLPIVLLHKSNGYDRSETCEQQNNVIITGRGHHKSVGIPISPRHFLTSESLFSLKKRGIKLWKNNLEKVQKCQEGGPRKVPAEAMLELKMNGDSLKIKESLVFCDYAADEELKSYPMVIETEFPLNISISCLPTNGFVLNDGDQVKTVEYIPDEKKFKEIDLIINSSTPLNYSTVIKDSKAVPLDGTPLYYHSPSGSSVLIGIFYEKVGGKLNYHNVAFYEGKFCEILSICPALTTTPQTSIQLTDSKDSDERKESNPKSPSSNHDEPEPSGSENTLIWLSLLIMILVLVQ